MFGSLVIVFPTVHEGGGLTLRHNKKEWTFDSAKAVAEHDTPHIAYTAFYSDVEHEVMPVKSGYRVTVTYNLYFSDPSPAIPETSLVVQNPLVASAFRIELERLLTDPTFVPEGGNLMFGLRHQYPVELENLEWRADKKALLQGMSAYLKGSDAVVYKVCGELGLRTLLQLVFEDEDWDDREDDDGDYVPPEEDDPADLDYNTDDSYSSSEDGSDGSSESSDEEVAPRLTPLVACDRLVNMAGAGAMPHKLFYSIREDYGGKLLTAWEDEEPDLEVLWATRLPKFNKFKATYLAYGNEASMQHTYAHLSLLVEIGAVNDRTTVDKPRPPTPQKKSRYGW